MPTVRETQWKMARDALARAASVTPATRRMRALLRYCEGHLHRINGEARKARRQTAEAQHEFTDAVTAFREAAELRPNWPDPFLGLMRTFIYGLEDVDRGADALQQAQRLGYTPGDRETVQLADGYLARGDTFARTARTLAGLAQEQEYLTRAAEAYRQAIERFSKVLGMGDAARSLRQAQRGLKQVEQRLANLSEPRPEPPPNAARTVAVTFTPAAERDARRRRERAAASATAIWLLITTSCVVVLAIALTYAGRFAALERSGRAPARRADRPERSRTAGPTRAGIGSGVSQRRRSPIRRPRVVPFSDYAAGARQPVSERRRRGSRDSGGRRDSAEFTARRDRAPSCSGSRYGGGRRNVRPPRRCRCSRPRTWPR